MSSSESPRHTLDLVPLDVYPNEVQLGDLLVHHPDLRKVVNLQRVGSSGLVRRLQFADGDTYLMQERGRVYRSPGPPPSTPARAGARTLLHPR